MGSFHAKIDNTESVLIFIYDMSKSIYSFRSEKFRLIRVVSLILVYRVGLKSRKKL